MKFEKTAAAHETLLGDESRLQGRADWFCFPESVEEAAAALKQAAEENLPVTVQGARTGIAGGAVPNGGLALNLGRLTALPGLAQTEEGFVLQVQAGMPLQAVEDFLARPTAQPGWDEASLAALAALKKAPRQFFPPNPTETTATLGGMFAVNAGGMNALLYGGTGRHVAALRWLTPAGEEWHIARGQYVFDESGCPLPGGARLAAATNRAPSPLAALCPAPGTDLIDFLAGSEGALGLAAQLSLRLAPKPTESWGVVYFFANDGEAMAFTEGLRRWHEAADTAAGALAAAEYYDDAVLTLVAAHKQNNTQLKTLPDFPAGVHSAVYVELCGNDADALEAMLMEHLELFSETGGQEENTWAAGSESEMEKFRTLRHSVPELLNAEVDRLRQAMPSFTKMGVDYMATAADVADYCRLYHEGAAAAGVRCYVFGHLMENHLHVNLLPQNEEERAACVALAEAWAARVMADGGRLAAENGVGRLKRALVCTHLSPADAETLASIKRQLDPAGRMGPGPEAMP